MEKGGRSFNFPENGDDLAEGNGGTMASGLTGRGILERLQGDGVRRKKGRNQYRIRERAEKNPEPKKKNSFS